MRKEYIGLNINKLHDELIVKGIKPLLIESLNDKTWVTFADNTDMDLVQQIIDAHDPTPLPPLKTREQILEERLQVTEDALLGLMDIIMMGGM